MYIIDRITEKRILNSVDALKCKEAARDIKDFKKDDWDAHAEELCYEGIKQKFEQNPHLKEALMDTGNKTIAEACHDTVWGTEKPLSDVNCLTQTKWEGVGILGRILMKIRDSSTETDMYTDDEEEEEQSNNDSDENT